MEIVCYKGRFTVKPVASDCIPPSMLRKEYYDLHQSEHDDFTLVEASGVNKAICSRLLALYSPSTKAKNGGNVVMGRWYIPFVFVKEEMSLSEQVKQPAYYEITLKQFWEQIRACESVYGVERVAEKLRSVERVEEYRGGVGGWKRFDCYVLVEKFVLRRMDDRVVPMVDFRHIKKVRRRKRKRSEKKMTVGGRKKRREREEERYMLEIDLNWIRTESNESD
ncbi:hypothetical protein Cni_G15907 [Canna indica]|uniref:Uncharacterized protein n=1 Tax=Canna indica TaxID=4628 RepID=A0AAQ3QDS1_9LILI|nr:hypothetical protein Cni_G15907 [Canna indica]